jgi:Arsenical resistance operon protein ArsD
MPTVRVFDPPMCCPTGVCGLSVDPFAWVIHQSFSPLSVTDPVLRQRRAHELRYIREVSQRTARAVVVPWSAELGGGGRLTAFATEARS